MKYYTITEDNSNIVIAVVKTKRNENKENILKRIEAVKLAVKEEWCYAEVHLVSYEYDEMTNQMSFDCITEDEEEEIRVVDLNLTTLYK